MQRVQDWLSEAEGELRAAQDLYAHGHSSWCCFTCQQVAEKTLKGLGEHFRYQLFGHNLNLLSQALQTHLAVPEEVRQACGQLNRYYIPTRYPNAFDQGAPVDQFFESDAREALEYAETIFQFARRVIETS